MEKKTRIVLSVIAGEMSIADAARRERVSEQSIGRWKAEFLEAGKTALAAGRNGPTNRQEQLEAEVVELTQALGEAAVEIRVWKKSAEGRLGPSRTSRWGYRPARSAWGNQARVWDVDREVVQEIRHPRADLAALAGQGPCWPACEGPVAAAGPRCCP